MKGLAAILLLVLIGNAIICLSNRAELSSRGINKPGQTVVIPSMNNKTATTYDTTYWGGNLVVRMKDGTLLTLRPDEVILKK